MSDAKGMTPYTPELNEFFEKMTKKMIAKVTNQADPTETPVGKFLGPKELSEEIEFEIPEDQTFDFKKLEKAVDFVMKTVTRTDHPMYFNQLFAAPDPVGVLGDWLGSSMNTTMATYENAGAFLIMENSIIKMLCQAIGWGDDEGDGQVCPGGSACNQMGVMLARYSKFPESKLKGMGGLGQLVIFTSDESHYSIDKAAFMCGFGLDNCVKVKCDALGRMEPAAFEADIERTIAEGKVPLMVNCTASTTVRGNFDPFEDIGKICKKYGMWMHIDGAWGGPTILSRKYKDLMKGCEYADSFTFDAHKCLGMTQQCSMVLVKEKGLLSKCNSAKAAYLFQADKPHAEYDTGDKTVQCGRRNDILKVWLAWQGLGQAGVAARVDATFDIARKLYAKLTSPERKAQGFVAIQPPAGSNTLYYCIPGSLRNDPIAERLLNGEPAYELLLKSEAADFCQKIGKVAPYVKMHAVKEGSFMCGFQAVCGMPNFWRMVFANPNVSDEQLDTVLDVTSKYSEEWSSIQ